MWAHVINVVMSCILQSSLILWLPRSRSSCFFEIFQKEKDLTLIDWDQEKQIHVMFCRREAANETLTVKPQGSTKHTISRKCQSSTLLYTKSQRKQNETWNFRNFCFIIRRFYYSPVIMDKSNVDTWLLRAVASRILWLSHDTFSSNEMQENMNFGRM
jgi:hypothetical protein